MSIATWQLSRTTVGESSRIIHSFRCGSTSGVAMPPRASAASCRTISHSFTSRSTLIKDGTEWADNSWPKTNAISCLQPSQRQETTCGRFTHLKRTLSSEKPHASASTAGGVPMLRRANIARYLSKSGSSVASSFSLSDDMDASVTSSGFGCPDRRWEDGGAGSIEVYVLS